MSREHDELHTAKFLIGGEIVRTPGQYFLDRTYDEKGVKYKTNEWIHPVVRLRMLKYKNKDGSDWKPPSLKDFQLSKDEQGWKWMKKVDVGGKEPETITLREWPISYGETEENGSMDSELLTAEAWAQLQDTASSSKIQPVKVKSSGWWPWS